MGEGLPKSKGSGLQPMIEERLQLMCVVSFVSLVAELTCITGFRYCLEVMFSIWAAGHVADFACRSCC